MSSSVQRSGSGATEPAGFQGSAIARKRTALFEVRENGLAYLTDFPSNGDTSYVGLVMEGDAAYLTYYTSPLSHDFPWAMGMLLPTEIRMVKIDLKAMETLANQTEAK